MRAAVLKLCRRCLFWLLLLPCGMAHAGFDIVVVLSRAEGPHQVFAQHFSRAASRLGHRVQVVSAEDEPLDPAVLRDVDLVVSSGELALTAVLQRPERPTLAVMLGQQAFERLRALEPTRALGAMPLDQPPSRQLRLFRALLPQAQQLALLQQSYAAKLESFSAAAAECGLELQTAQLDDPRQLVQQLDVLLRDSDALLVLAEAAVSAPAAVRSILLTSYRQRKPLLAFSQAYVDAGALAAVFTTPGQVAEQVLSWLAQQDGELPRLPELSFPPEFELAVNRKVARSLGLQIAPDEVLIREIAGGDCR
ncbi:MAG: ABC transporter substrate binding protein [Thauera sp.]|jgi:hypothetical protein|nr:ABC transporter substrate binding protein [Thauera sp.]